MGGGETWASPQPRLVSSCVKRRDWVWPSLGQGLRMSQATSASCSLLPMSRGCSDEKWRLPPGFSGAGRGRPGQVGRSRDLSAQVWAQDALPAGRLPSLPAQAPASTAAGGRKGILATYTLPLPRGFRAVAPPDGRCTCPRSSGSQNPL